MNTELGKARAEHSAVPSGPGADTSWPRRCALHWAAPGFGAACYFSLQPHLFPGWQVAAVIPSGTRAQQRLRVSAAELALLTTRAAACGGGRRQEHARSLLGIAVLACHIITLFATVSLLYIFNL